MKKLFLLLAALLAHTAFAQTTITALPAASALGGTEVTPCDQSGTTTKCSVAQINSYIVSLGNGTGLVALTSSPNFITPAIKGSSTGVTTIASANAGATNYTATLPANNGTLGELNLVQTWSAAQTFNQPAAFTIATGTAPFSVSSTTNVPNLNASSLSGATFASPGAIGGTSPGAGTFLALTANGVANINASNNAATNIGTGTTTSAVSFCNVLNVCTFDGPIALAQGTSYSGSTWTTAGIGISVGAATFNDSTATGTTTSEAINAIAAPTLTSTSAATITNLSNLYLAAPVASTNVTATHLLALQTPGIIASVQPSIAANTVVDGIWLNDPTAAATTNEQYSPAIHFTGQAWHTGSGGASQSTDWEIFNQATEGFASTAQSYINFVYSVGGGSYNSEFSVSQSGQATANAYAITGSGASVSTIGNGINASASNTLQLIAGSTSVATFTSTTDNLPTLPASTAAQTGYVCWSSTGGALSYDTTNTCLVSSERYKHDIEPLNEGLDAVMKLRPVSYQLNDDMNPAHIGRQVGFVAEEVQKVDATLTPLDNEGKPRAVEYDKIAVLAVGAIQDQQREIASLQRQVLALWIFIGLLGAGVGILFVRRR